MFGHVSGGNAADSRSSHGAEPGGASAASGWKLDPVLAAMIAKGHGLEALQCFLGVTIAFILERVVACGMATPHDHPLRRNTHPRAWPSSDLPPFIECWIANWDVGSMSDTFGRSRGGIYALIRRLGLPGRRRGDIRRPTTRAVAAIGAARRITTGPGTGSSTTGGLEVASALVTKGCVAQPPLLTRRQQARVTCTLAATTAPTAATARRRTDGLEPAQAQAEAPSLPEPETGMRRVRTVTGFDGLPLAVEVRDNRGQVAWTPRLELYVASTRWAGQHPRAAARDLGISFGAIRTRLDLMEVPSRPRVELTEAYDAELARKRLRKAGLEVRRCSKHEGRLFFGDRFTVVAPITRRSSKYQRELSSLDH